MAEHYSYPLVRKHLSDYYEMTWRCAKCGYCRNVFPSDTEHERFGRQCPPGERFKYEAYFASGRSETARRLIEGKQGLTARLRHILYTCTTCGACEEWCQATQWRNPLLLEYAVRNHFVRAGGELLPQHQKTVRSIEKNRNRLNRNNRDRRAWLQQETGTPCTQADTAYFVGCRSSFNRTEIARNAYELLTRKLGIPLALLEQEHCCGRPLLDIGEEEGARELMAHNVRQIEATGARRVVFTCAECFSTFANLGAYGIAAGFEPVHLSQLLAEQLQRRPAALQGLNGTAAFHDPCYLGRHQGVYDQPRAVLASIPGIRLVEMPRNRKNAWCCGAGGGVQEAYPDYSQWVARERFEEVLHVQADILVTACPGCKENLWGLAAAHRIRIFDIAELTNMLLREE